jgi:hypothetical protein
MKQARIDKAVVGYIDVLGYGKIVEKHMDNIEVIHRIEDLLKTAPEVIKKLKNNVIRKPDSESDSDDYFNKVLDAINIRFISDTVLYTLQFSKMPFGHSNKATNETICDCIYALVMMISQFCVTFIAKTGLVFRGGIAIGPHYETEYSDLGNNLFIFSKAYIRAYYLEQSADEPRILIDEQLLELLQKLSFNYMERFFYEDANEKKCFDIYAFLQHDDLSQEVLKEIKKGVTLNLENSLKKESQLKKLIYFAKYHNRKVDRDNLNFDQLSIDVRKYENLS